MNVELLGGEQRSHCETRGRADVPWRAEDGAIRTLGRIYDDEQVVAYTNDSELQWGSALTKICTHPSYRLSFVLHMQSKLVDFQST